MEVGSVLDKNKEIIALNKRLWDINSTV